MGAFTEYESFDGLGLAELIKKKDVSPREVVDAALDRMHRWNPRLHFVVTSLASEARAAADGPLPEGPFTGVPYLLKDLLASYRGVPLQSGSKLYRDHVPDHDSELVARHRRAGLVAIAKTATPELGITPVTEPPTHPPTETPWRAGHTSGGSSGGSAAGVGARVAPIGHGGDGGGSIRIPAACCGVFGMKPSRGRTPAGPDASEHWFGFAIEHAITRSVRDSAALLDATTERETFAPYAAPAAAHTFLEETRRAPGKLRIAYTTRPHLPGETHPDCVRAVEDVAKLCASLGHHVEEAAPTLDGHAFARDFVTHIAVATAASLELCEEVLGRVAKREDVHTETWLIAMLGRTIAATELTKARHRLHAQTRRLASFYDRYDVLLTPTLGMPPVRIGELAPGRIEALLHEAIARADARAVLKLPGLIDAMAERVFRFVPFTPLANVTGQPSMSVPLFWNGDGLPIGTMFTARPGEDGTLFRLAAQLEQARPWADRKPSA